MEPRKDLPFRDPTDKILGCAVRAHRELGPGFLESADKNAMILAMQEGGLKFAVESSIDIEFSGKIVGRHRLDLDVEERVVIELKAVEDVTRAPMATLKSYLRASKRRVGLLINFSKSKIEVHRVIL